MSETGGPGWVDEIADRHDVDVVWAPICFQCRHLDPGRGRTCRAFPQGIPDEVWDLTHVHKDPYPGDHGIQFEPRAGTPAPLPRLTLPPGHPSSRG